MFKSVLLSEKAGVGVGKGSRRLHNPLSAGKRLFSCGANGCDSYALYLDRNVWISSKFGYVHKGVPRESELFITSSYT